MKISEVTKRKIITFLNDENVAWFGSLGEHGFLSRLFDLEALPSTNRRFRSASHEIFQHRVNNDDWHSNWVFQYEPFNLMYGEDEIFLRFVCMMLHPVVRPNTEEVEKLKTALNDFLRIDGFQIVERTSISGHPVFAAKSIEFTRGPLQAAKSKFTKPDMSYVIAQITRIETSVDKSPDLAIGTAKELVETICKRILEEYKVEVDPNWSLPSLVGKTSEHLALTPKNISDEARASKTIKAILGNMATITQGLAELRNHYGTGHGKNPLAKGLQPRHAKLAANAATTLAVFLMETFEQRTQK